MEIEENGRTYVVQGDYPNGRYVKVLKTDPMPEPATVEDRLSAIEAKLEKLATIETKIDSMKATVEAK